MNLGISLLKLKNLIAISKYIGRNLDLVQGAGGNTSIKQNNKMWIKASGTWLSKSIEENIFVEVNLDRIRKNILLNIYYYFFYYLAVQLNPCIIGEIILQHYITIKSISLMKN